MSSAQAGRRSVAGLGRAPRLTSTAIHRDRDRHRWEAIWVFGPEGQLRRADVINQELHVGTGSMFEAAGLRKVSAPTDRRVVMRVDFQNASTQKAPCPG